jgi:4-amino-4-deoxychorismate lyase
LAALGQPVVLRALQDADLLSLEALFFCNAVRGVMPVRELIVGNQWLELSLRAYTAKSV